MLAALFGVFSGALMPVQTSVNTRLRRSVGSPLMASFFSFLVGTCALLVATLITSGHLLPALGLTAGQPWWIYTGGALGVVVLTGNILLFPRVGSVQTVILPITGQIFMGLLIDAQGLLGSPQVGLGPLRVGGALAVLLGAAAVVGALRPGRRQAPRQPGIWLWRAFGVFMGMCSATQIAVNGRLGTILGSAVESALVSFSVGTATLLLLLLLTRTPWRGVEGGPWWMWLGGILGATVVFATALLGPILGTGLTVVLMLLGMMTASLLIDTLGLIGGVRIRVGWTQLLGLGIIITGVALIRVV
ncbi:DMT family transporter [Corynebacterium pacaense]|uniref:DMT family transporter n=1 Tax=Corynebacterium pacaense TaxID=1816684 RepID=UPI0009BC3F30|nr:DMT family transporter [Corynebacterium pacaense]